MPVGIVDLFKTVQIDHDDPRRVFASGIGGAFRDPLGDSALDFSSIVQPGKLIGYRHNGEQLVGLYDLGRRRVDEVRQTPDHAHGRFVLRDFPVQVRHDPLDGAALAHAGEHQGQVVVVHGPLPADQFPRSTETVDRCHLVQRPGLAAALGSAPEGLPAEAVKNRDHLGRKAAQLFHIAPHILENGFGVTVGQVDDAALGDVRAHVDGPVLVAGQGVAQKHAVPVVHGKGELQRVVENMFIIRDLQIVLINLVCGHPVQFVQDLSPGAGDLHWRTQLAPADDKVAHNVQVRSAHQGHDDAVGVELAVLLKDIGGKGVVAESAAAPDRNPLGDLFLENAADLADRDGVDGHDDLDGLHAAEGLFHIAEGLAQYRRVTVLHRDQAGAEKAVRLFKDRTGDDQPFGGYAALIKVSGCGCTDAGCVRHHLFQYGTGSADLIRVGPVREHMDQRLTGIVILPPALPRVHGFPKRLRILIGGLKLSHLFPL